MPEQMSFEDALRARDAVLDLIADDWTHEPSKRAVAAAILRAGREHPDGLVDCNSIRSYLPPWVAPFCIGTTFLRLSGKRLGLIEQVPDVTVRNTDPKSKNVGKRMPVWKLTPRAYEKDAA